MEGQEVGEGEGEGGTSHTAVIKSRMPGGRLSINLNQTGFF